MSKKQSRIPKHVLKGLAEDIQLLMPTNQGKIVVLEIIEEIPYEIRFLVLESLSAFYSDNMVEFFHLLSDEYGKELEAVCTKALVKYAMSNLDVTKKPFFNGEFYKAYASCSRPTGRITLDVAWLNDNGNLHVECFYLTFNADGVHSFFLIPDMPFDQYSIDREFLSHMVEITEQEAAFLITEAYYWNLYKMTRPAIGKFLYNKYLDLDVKFSAIEKQNLIYKLSGRLTPRQIVNSFYFSIKYQDFTYINAIWPHISLDLMEESCRDLLGLSRIILEGQADQVFANATNAEVTSYALVVEGNHCYQLNYRFYLVRENGFWIIQDIKLVDKTFISPSSPHNPYNIEVFCRVYEIMDLDELFELLEKIDNIREVVELPYGLHLRITTNGEDFNYGVSFLSGTLADIIINGDEFVIISRDYETLVDLHNLLFCHYIPPLHTRGEYQVDLVTAYNYVGGNYVSFEDVLILDTDHLAVANDFRFVTTIYLVKDRNKVLNYIKNISNAASIVDNDYTIFYQYEYKNEDKVLLAEYVLGEDWLTLSTFGHNDMYLVRQSLELSLYDCLELDGMEIREDGLFDILTIEMKKAYPDLEKFLKELYLNKWYNSSLDTLGGLSPSEALETEEGKKLLWGLIKKIYQIETRNLRRGKYSSVKIKEYIDIIEKKQGKK